MNTVLKGVFKIPFVFIQQFWGDDLPEWLNNKQPEWLGVRLASRTSETKIMLGLLLSLCSSLFVGHILPLIDVLPFFGDSRRSRPQAAFGSWPPWEEGAPPYASGHIQYPREELLLTWVGSHVHSWTKHGVQGDSSLARAGLHAHFCDLKVYVIYVTNELWLAAGATQSGEQGENLFMFL